MRVLSGFCFVVWLQDVKDYWAHVVCVCVLCVCVCVDGGGDLD